ncbi:cytochrome P450, partial [Periconia macrospinosa]
LLILCKITYNLLFHPLRSYPGPLFGRASRLYYIYYQFSGELPFLTKALHDKYGAVVRIAPDELSYSSGDAWQDIYGHRSSAIIASKGSFEKDKTWYTNVGESVSIVTTSDRYLSIDHKRFRRVMGPAFSERTLKAQEYLMKRHVDLLISQLHKRVEDKGSVGVDIVRWLNFITFDIIGDLTFGQSFGCLETGELHPWIQWVFGGVKESCFFQAILRVPGIQGLLKPLFHLKNDNWKQQYEYCAQKAKERMEMKTERPDIMTHILQANDEKGLTEKEILDNAQVLVIAGSETTATVLAGCVFYLARNPDAYNKVTAEIRTSFALEDGINTESLSRLPYFNAVLEEALRVYPPLAVTLPRTTPLSGEVIAGKFVAGGTTVGVNHWSYNYSSENFKDPEFFLPERWLSEENSSVEQRERFAGDQRKQFNPFSFGPRNCIGKNLAYAEMRLIMGRLLWNFDIELEPGFENWAKQKVYILWEKPDLGVKLTPVVR